MRRVDSLERRCTSFLLVLRSLGSPAVRAALHAEDARIALGGFGSILNHGALAFSCWRVVVPPFQSLVQSQHNAIMARAGA